MKYFDGHQSGIVVVSLGPGDLLLEGIRRVSRELDIHTGMLITGIGSLSYGRIHIVASNDVPPQEKYFDIPGPLEVVGFRGIIAGYMPHVHISLMDAQGKFYGGHLEEGCQILTVCEISILRAPDLKLTRRLRDGSVIPQLDWE